MALACHSLAGRRATTLGNASWIGCADVPGSADCSSFYEAPNGRVRRLCQEPEGGSTGGCGRSAKLSGCSTPCGDHLRPLGVQSRPCERPAPACGLDQNFTAIKRRESPLDGGRWCGQLTATTGYYAGSVTYNDDDATICESTYIWDSGGQYVSECFYGYIDSGALIGAFGCRMYWPPHRACTPPTQPPAPSFPPDPPDSPPLPPSSPPSPPSPPVPPRPPAPPQPPFRPPLLPLPPAPPPLLPGQIKVLDTEGLRKALEGVAGKAELLLASGRFKLTGAALVVPSAAELTLRGTGADADGTVIDADGRSGIILVQAGGQLRLENIGLVNGRADRGAAVDASGKTTMMDVSIRNCHADNGGAVYSAGVDVDLEFVDISDCSASRKGGAIYLTHPAPGEPGNQIRLSHVRIASCEAGRYGENTTFASGGALFLDGDRNAAQIDRSEIVRCSAHGGRGGGVDSAGAVRMTRSIISFCSAAFGGCMHMRGLGLGDSSIISDSNLSYCSATHEGGALFSTGGRIVLRNRSLLRGGVAPVGRSIMFLGGDITYALPAPLGRWLPNALCKVYRKACEYPPYDRPKQEACLLSRDSCSLSLQSAGQPPNYCMAPSFVQPCNWNTDASGDPFLLGKSLYQDFPFACAAGLHGSTDTEDQSSSACGGPCLPGTASAEGTGSCVECEPGFYASNPGQGKCIPCPHPLSSASGSVTCSVCKEGFYLLDSSADPGGNRDTHSDLSGSPTEHCKPCPPDANCSDFNTTLETIRIPRGHWRASGSSLVLYPCRSLGGGDSSSEKRCVGGTTAGGNGYCDTQFTGPECQLCSESNLYLVDGEECKECASLAAAASRFTGVILGVIIACGILAWAYRMQSWRQRRFIGPPLRFTDRLIHWSVAIGLQAKLKILFGFYQARL